MLIQNHQIIQYRKTENQNIHKMSNMMIHVTRKINLQLISPILDSPKSVSLMCPKAVINKLHTGYHDQYIAYAC